MVVFSLIYVTYFAIATKDAWFFKIIFLLLGLYELVGVLYLLKNGLYLKKGEKYEKPKSVPPEEFLAKVKKEVLNGK